MTQPVYISDRNPTSRGSPGEPSSKDGTMQPVTICKNHRLCFHGQKKTFESFRLIYKKEHKLSLVWATESSLEGEPNQKLRL